MRKATTVLIATEHGPMMINRMDYQQFTDAAGKTGYIGVGCALLEHSVYGDDEISQLLGLLEARRRVYGEPVIAFDIGANIGVHTLSFGRAMTGWGFVNAFEAQERVFYMLAGNVALNNLNNVKCFLAAVTDRSGTMQVPVLDYGKAANFGGLNLKPRVGLVDVNNTPLPESTIGQPVDYAKTQPVAALRIDDLNAARADLFKIDVEGMEPEVLRGARKTIEKYRPIIFAEQFLCGTAAIMAALPVGYEIHNLGSYLLAVHKSDRVRELINFRGETDAVSA